MDAIKTVAEQPKGLRTMGVNIKGQEKTTWSLKFFNHAVGRRNSHLHAIIYNYLCINP